MTNGTINWREILKTRKRGQAGNGILHVVELNGYDTGFTITEYTDEPDNSTPVGIQHGNRWNDELNQKFPRFNWLEQALEHIAVELGLESDRYANQRKK